jgi:hypothetical protein
MLLISNYNINIMIFTGLGGILQWVTLHRARKKHEWQRTDILPRLGWLRKVREVCFWVLLNLKPQPYRFNPHGSSSWKLIQFEYFSEQSMEILVTWPMLQGCGVLGRCCAHVLATYWMGITDNSNNSTRPQSLNINHHWTQTLTDYFFQDESPQVGVTMLSFLPSLCRSRCGFSAHPVMTDVGVARLHRDEVAHLLKGLPCWSGGGALEVRLGKKSGCCEYISFKKF